MFEEYSIQTTEEDRDLELLRLFDEISESVYPLEEVLEWEKRHI